LGDYLNDVFEQIQKPGDSSDRLFNLCVMLSISFFAMLFLSRLIRMNEFSLHGLYRDRLIRGYYGGFRSKKKRREPQLFTGFDPNDDVEFEQIQEIYRGRSAKEDQLDPSAAPPEPPAPIAPGYAAKFCGTRSLKPPFLVVNTALNLLKGEALAWQERKADSFTFTALHAGNSRLGYREVGKFAQGIKLGTAMAISGAAFNPNMGYNSSAPMAFLMSLFNVRLGWWLGSPAHLEARNDPTMMSRWQRLGQSLRCNPDGNSWKERDPTCPAKQLLLEAAGQTSDSGPWIHLSDGGHFDNLGLWEMVYRRCRKILIVDASQDASFSMDQLYSAIRKIRIDMGIEIDDDGEPVQLFPRSARASGLHYAHFRIHYDRLYPSEDGRSLDGDIIYVKPCFYGTEPPDVMEYAEKNPAFPHESTADQFFNESQFESYRKLGEYEMERVLARVHPASASFSNLFFSRRRKEP
jgi:hypothetical protein